MDLLIPAEERRLLGKLLLGAPPSRLQRLSPLAEHENRLHIGSGFDEALWGVHFDRQLFRRRNVARLDAGTE